MVNRGLSERMESPGVAQAEQDQFLWDGGLVVKGMSKGIPPSCVILGRSLKFSEPCFSPL